MPFKIYIFIFILAASAVIGCKKKENNSGSPNNITFHEFNPLIGITSVDSFTAVWANESYSQPHPLDSSVSQLLDINNDLIPDFVITVNHWYQFVSASGPSANHNYNMSISGVNNSSEITTLDETSTRVYFYAQNESIDWKGEWKNTATLQRTGGAASVNHTSFTGTHYVGLRIKTGSFYNYAWLKVNRESIGHQLELVSYGYNNTLGNSVLAGEE